MPSQGVNTRQPVLFSRIKNSCFRIESFGVNHRAARPLNAAALRSRNQAAGSRWSEVRPRSLFDKVAQVLQLDREIDVIYRNSIWHLQYNSRKIQNRLDTGFDQLICG
jgi:hypothetical protein